MIQLYDVKQNLLKIASKVITYTNNELTGDVDLEKKFDFIKSEVYGVVSFSPQENFELENLNYSRDDQGRDYFSSFITLAIQCGVAMGHEQKNKEISELKENLKTEKELKQFLFSDIKELRNNQLPKDGDLSEEIIKLRKEISELKEQNTKLSTYKSAFETMKKTIDFWK